MRMYDIIAKKRDGNILSSEEINFFIHSYTNGDIPDYQASALLMAIFINGMTSAELAALTQAMAMSGDTIDLSGIDGIKVDKHSTGGVGDKTTLVITPIVAACGCKVAKMSGRGLGHTGGTIDKMESIPHMRVALSKDDFIKQVNDIGIAIIGQSGNLAPADKKLYALRDVTATINSIPLIASSIMSKKIAAGADCILLDVKTGSGSFMKTLEKSKELAQTMVDIGKSVGLKTAAVITDMDVPLGHAIGNSLEVIEAISVLKGEGPADLTEVCIDLATEMLFMSDIGERDTCMSMVKKSIADGSAFNKLRELVIAQGGDISVIDNAELFPKAKRKKEVISQKTGYITTMDTEKIGLTAMTLGAGRKTKEDSIDYSAGIYINAKPGDYVKQGETIATLYAENEARIKQAIEMYTEAVEVGAM